MIKKNKYKLWKTLKFMLVIGPPTRLKEILYFNAVEFETKTDGKFYVFFAIDAFSKSVINTGRFKELKPIDIMNQVFELMIHKDFKEHEYPFTLLMDVGEEIAEDLNLIVEAFNGKILFDHEYFQAKIKPEFALIMESIQTAI